MRHALRNVIALASALACLMPSSVDLPQPEGPIKVQNAPSSTESETSWSASTGPELERYRLVTPSTTISSGRALT